MNASVTELNLEKNNIGDTGASALSNALELNFTLTYLNLSFNSIEDIGAIAFADSLKVNSSLVTLDLGANTFGNIGITALAQALKMNIGVISLYLDQLRNMRGEMGDNIVTELAEALRFNPTLTYLNISSDPLGDTAYNKFGEVGDNAMQEIVDYKVDNQKFLQVILMKIIDDDGAHVLSSVYRMKFAALKAYILARGY